MISYAQLIHRRGSAGPSRQVPAFAPEISGMLEVCWDLFTSGKRPGGGLVNNFFAPRGRVSLTRAGSSSGSFDLYSRFAFGGFGLALGFYGLSLTLEIAFPALAFLGFIVLLAHIGLYFVRRFDCFGAL